MIAYLLSLVNSCYVLIHSHHPEHSFLGEIFRGKNILDALVPNPVLHYNVETFVYDHGMQVYENHSEEQMTSGWIYGQKLGRLCRRNIPSWNFIIQMLILMKSYPLPITEVTKLFTHSNNRCSTSTELLDHSSNSIRLTYSRIHLYTYKFYIFNALIGYNFCETHQAAALL